MWKSLVLALVACLAWAASAAAQDVVHLRSGDEVAGKAKDGLLALEVVTPGGVVRIPWKSVDRIDRADYVRHLYATRAKDVGKDDAAGHFLLARWCRRHGLAEEMTKELKRVIAIEPDHAAAREALGYEKVDRKWVAGDGILEAKGFVRRDGRWLLKEEAAFEDILKARKKALSEPEEKAISLLGKSVSENPRIRKYARQTLAARPWDEVRIPLYRALGEKEPALRAFAAEELGRRAERESARPLIRSAILDRDESVRAAAVAAVKSLGEPQVLFPFVRALASANGGIRKSAAEGIGRLGDVRGIEYLVRRLKQNWGPTQRNNISVMNQISYIRDFDVEIAQAAQIGDPIVGVLREGVILDVQIYGVDRTIDTVERRIIRRALVRLTGEDVGDDATAWERYWRENRERLLAKTK